MMAVRPRLRGEPPSERLSPGVIQMPENQPDKGQRCRSTFPKDKKLQRIRARASYVLFRQLHDFLKDSPSATDVLRKVHDILDARWSFGSRRNADYAAESLDLVLRDNGEVSAGQEQPDESQAIAKAPDNAPERSTGNFVLGEFFGDVKCRHGHQTRLFNIHRGHFVACDECRAYIFVGSNLMSNWRQENEEVWQRNSDSVEGYELLE